MFIPKICVTINSLIGLKSQLQMLLCLTLSYSLGNHHKFMKIRHSRLLEQNIKRLKLLYIDARLAS